MGYALPGCTAAVNGSLESPIDANAFAFLNFCLLFFLS